MAKYVKTDYVPEEAKWYITAGKEYKIENDGFGGGQFISDDGDMINIYYTDSSHLNGRDWTVINR